MTCQRADKLTLDLFDWTPPKVAVNLPEAHTSYGTIDTQIARAVAHVLSNSPLSRDEISQKMSSYLGDDVSKNMLDAYASQAREAHKITLERFIALIDATGNMGPLGFVAGYFGHVVVPKAYGELIDLHHIKEKKAELELLETVMARKWGVKR